MSKKLCFLMFFVLVLSLSGLAQADAIEVNNPSFELDINGVQITEQIWVGNIGGWKYRNESDWDAADAWMYATSEDDPELNFEGFDAPDGTVAFTSATMDIEPDDIVQIYQILDDANAIIVANRRYTLTFEAINPSETVLSHDVNAGLFYSTGLDVNGEANSVNDVTLASSRTPLLNTSGDYSNWDEVTLNYTALSVGIGERLIIRLSVPGSPDWPGGHSNMIDNVRVKWAWAVDAYNPSPSDEADDVVRDVNLTWSPGTSADEHIVYFGTDWADVNNRSRTAGPNDGVVDVTTFDPTPGGGLLDLGQTYYWTITEINDSYVSSPPIPDPPWLGEIWSFRVGGLAKAIYPVDRGTGVPALGSSLYWEAGLGAGGHDVYFGTDEADVENATTASDPNLYRGNQPLSDVNYALEDLTVLTTYYWRIDEVNAGTGTFVKGDVWRFLTGTFLVVDSFEPHRYEDTGDLTTVWTDPLANPKNDAQLSLFSAKTDSAKVYTGSQSMLFGYRCDVKQGSYHGSYAAADMPTEVGTDWTTGGIKALMVNFYGDPCNGIEPTPYPITNDQMYVELEDGSANSGLVKLPNMSEVKEASWHEWNISLIDPNFSGVDMNNVARIYIGFGGDKVGQAKAGAGNKTGNFDSVWFDDIRLYPPRCRPETGIATGDFDGDCIVGFPDLDVITGDWLMSGQWVAASPPAAPPEVWYRFDEGSGSTVENSGSWSGYDITVGGVDAPSWDSNVAPVLDPCDPNYAMDFDADDYLSIPNDAPSQFAGTQNMTITAWVRPEAEMGQWDYPSVVESRIDPGGDMHASGFGFGEYNKLIYWWNDDYWDFDAGPSHPYVDDESSIWSFIAVTVEPTQAKLYLSDGSSISVWTNVQPHDALVDWDPNYANYIGVNSNNADPANWNTFQGKIDDLRLYNKTLPVSEVASIAGVEGLVYVPLNSVADLVVGDKDPCYPDIDDQVDFRDYAFLADRWLSQQLWP